jgi:hypothetical protein
MDERIIQGQALGLKAVKPSPLADAEVNPQPLPCEDPEQDLKIYPRWEYPERRDPKWGEVTKQGLIVGRGAKQRVVPPDEVYKLATMGCPDLEIAEWFGIDDQTLRYNFKQYLAKARSHLKQRLRQAQIRTALDGNATLLIWLGKNMLGQSDNPLNSEDSKPLPWNEEE